MEVFGDFDQPFDRSHDPRREPGPINLRRYNFVPAYAGIATFCGVPLCLNQEDLRAGKVDVAIVGAPVDTSLGHRGRRTARVRCAPTNGCCRTCPSC